MFDAAELLVEATRVSKTYSITKKKGRKKITRMIQALKDVSLSIPRGKIVSLLGPNGAGKTTFIKILCTLLLPDSGEVRILGHPISDVRFIRKSIGVDLGNPRAVYWRLTAEENLELFAALYGIKGRKKKERIKTLLDLVGLSEFRKQRVETFSLGMIRRLQIARTLIHDPPILLLDEPTLGLDVNIAKEMRTFIKNELVKNQGKCVLLTTHYMEEARWMSDYVNVIYKGRLIAQGTPKELEDAYGYGKTVTFLELQGNVQYHDSIVQSIFGEITKKISSDQDTTTFEILAPLEVTEMERLIQKCKQRECRIKSVAPKKPSFEDVFLRIISRENHS